MRYLYFLFLLLLLCCNKTKISETKTLPEKSTALLIDNSFSMLSPDFQPNRISIIKKAILNIIAHKKENEALSIIIFSSESYILCPLTKDKNQLLASVNKLDTARIRKMPWGTNFTHALLNGISSLRGGSENKSMVLFSDGKEYKTWEYPSQIPIEVAFKNKIKINTVMIMPKDSIIAPIVFDPRDKIQYQKQKATPEDSNQLEKISSETGGSFKFFTTEEELLKFNFKGWISEKRKKPIKVGTYPVTNEELNMIYKYTKVVNDELYKKVNQ